MKSSNLTSFLAYCLATFQVLLLGFSQNKESLPEETHRLVKLVIPRSDPSLGCIGGISEWWKVLVAHVLLPDDPSLYIPYI